MSYWFKTLRPNGRWRHWDATGIVEAQRLVRGPSAPMGQSPDAIRWRVRRVEPAGCKLEGWGRTRKEAYEVLQVKESLRFKTETRSFRRSAKRSVNACAD